MTERDLINCVESVPGMRVKNLSWFRPSLRRIRRQLVADSIEQFRPCNITVVIH